jgi:hypothetical protein
MWGAILSAGLGAAFTAVATWYVSRYLDLQREARNLASAIAVVSTELEDNRNRLPETGSKVPLEPLTIGDWAAMKGAFAGLAMRNKTLWGDVVKAYGQIYGWISEGKDPPDRGELNRLVGELHTARENLEDEVRRFFPRLWRDGSNK